jgi:hypothetical protein
MPLSNYLPFRQIDEYNNGNFVAKTIDPEDVGTLSKVMKVASLALGYHGSVYWYNTRATFEPSPYDLERITQAVDTDSYIRQAMNKYKELFWKENWTIVGENPEAVAYLYQRIDFLEMTMKRPFLDFLIEVSDQLFKYANCFIVKARGDISDYFPQKLMPISAEQPIIGYYLIPTEQVRILRDRFNRPKSYQQRTDPLTYSPSIKTPVWTADRVIHMYFDKKAGRAFGTPFLTNVLDDVIALRQLEEDIQNLVHRELFPLYKYKIGTAEQPAEPEEITRAAAEIENLRTEGGLILPFRHDIEIVGSGGQVLNAQPYLEHFKERVAVGLGLAPHHLGMMMNGGNRSVTDRLDVALYDKVKQYQKQFAEIVRVNVFNELLFEGGFDPIKNPVEDGLSDRCYFKFNEIDVDTQVKKETHVMQKYTNSVITLDEARKELGLDPQADEDKLFGSVQARVQMDIAAHQADMQAANAPAPAGGQASKQNEKPAGTRNLPSKTKGPGNIIRPTNQQGTRTSPNIKRNDLSWLSVVENLLEKDYTVIYTDENSSDIPKDENELND